jgi:hypothetical protein
MPKARMSEERCIASFLPSATNNRVEGSDVDFCPTFLLQWFLVRDEERELTCNDWTHAAKSDWLNSYLQQPSAISLIFRTSGTNINLGIVGDI